MPFRVHPDSDTDFLSRLDFRRGFGGRDWRPLFSVDWNAVRNRSMRGVRRVSLVRIGRGSVCARLDGEW